MLLCWTLLLFTASPAITDSRPALIVASTSSAVPARRPGAAEEAVALLRLREASRAVSEATRSAEAAKQRLKKAREAARSARDEFERQRELAVASSRSAAADAMLADHERALRSGRAKVLCCLFAFTFLNGLARRSLSSAAPSMVAEGLVTVKRADEIFMVGFEAFAVGKFLVVLMTIALGLRRSLLVQLFMLTVSCASYLVKPASDAVQLGSWVVFRIFSAMAVSTMLPFVGAWFPRPYYGRIFAVLFCGFQLGYLTCSFYWQVGDCF